MSQVNSARKLLQITKTNKNPQYRKKPANNHRFLFYPSISQKRIRWKARPT